MSRGNFKVCRKCGERKRIKGKRKYCTDCRPRTGAYMVGMMYKARSIKARITRESLRAAGGTPLDARVQELGYRSYNDYLSGQHWQDFRDRYRASTRPQTCAVCGASSVSLHHVSYDRLGCERLSDVIPLCQPHHEALHVLLRARRWGVRKTAEAVTVLKGG